MMLRQIMLKTLGVIMMKNRSMSRYQVPKLTRVKMTVAPKDYSPGHTYIVRINDDLDKDSKKHQEFHCFGDSRNHYTTSVFFQKEDLDDKDQLKLFMMLKKNNGTMEFIHFSIDTSKKTDVVQWQNGTTDLDIIIRIYKDPDVTFRDVKQLCSREEEFVTKRKRFVYNNMIKNSILKTELEGKDESVVPRIAVIGSGGGLRATIGMSGALAELKTLGILDYTMYTAGLSGSQWYLMALYGYDEHLDPERMYQRIRLMLPQLSRIKLFRDTYKVWNNESFNLRIVVYIADSIFKEQLHVKWSQQTQKIEEGCAPLPFISALLVRDESKIQDSHEWIELSPYEVFIPNIGASIDMEQFGNLFHGGFVIDRETNIDIIGMLQIICSDGYAEVKNNKPSGGKLIQIYSVIQNWIRSRFSSNEECFQEVPNWLYGMRLIEPPMNEIDSKTDIHDFSNEMLHLVDASRVLNSPYPTILNPSRKIDVILSFDFSDRGKDTNWPFEELEKASEWAKRRQIPFPELDSQLKEIRNKCSERGTFDEVYVFPGGDDSPTIVHFVMINKSFAHSGGPDFEILPKYATNRYFYSEEEIANLARLMMFNVRNNNEKILDTILSKIKKTG